MARARGLKTIAGTLLVVLISYGVRIVVAAPPVEDVQPWVVTSPDGRLEIAVTREWKIVPEAGQEANISLRHPDRDLRVTVVSASKRQLLEEGGLGFEEVADTMASLNRKLVKRGRIVHGPVSTTIGGRPAIEYVIYGDDDRTESLVTVVSGTSHYHAVMAWGPRWTKGPEPLLHWSDLRTVTETLRERPGASTASAPATPRRSQPSYPAKIEAAADPDPIAADGVFCSEGAVILPKNPTAAQIAFCNSSGR